ncbi:MAG: extracellular solute-binding protein family 1 [Paenibacillaceae bacterium]|jgi:putative aldouronate transport system substrate-binding protein|nr:extracellular solute-binding protein family 1 [Paenibacillaceae bacterium]
MKQMKKVVGAVATGALLVPMLLAGCQGKDTAGETGTPPAGGATATAAATAQSLPEVKLVWYLRGTKPKNAEAVIAKANEITKAKINATVDYRFVEPGDYDQKMQLIMGAGEEFDICWTSSWSNNYVSNASKGAYLQLDDYLAKMPKLKAVLPEKVWNGVKVNGKIYGVNNYQVIGGPQGMSFRKDIIDKYKINLDNVKSVSDLTPILEQVKAQEPDLVMVKYGIPFVSLYGESGITPRVEDFLIDTNTWKVGSYMYADDSIVKHYELMRQWYQKGFFPQNVATAAEGDQSLEKAGKLFAQFEVAKPGADVELAQKYGYEVMVKPLTKPLFVTKATLTSTLNAVSRTSKNPERALMLLELMNTDKDLYNTMVFGLDNQDYKKNGDNRVEKIANTYQFDAWQLGNQFNAYFSGKQSDSVWEETKKMNDAAEIDPMVDFSFDLTPVQNELTQIKAAQKEFYVILKNGLDDPAKAMKNFKDKLAKSGEEKVRAEIQKQIDAWRKTK